MVSSNADSCLKTKIEICNFLSLWKFKHLHFFFWETVA
ncbi:hypothetical protein EUBDOL_01784 [Amedibacillus dolichus DSM 3991]|uniref:Uncharacterized protein n=1 Tax=Amedibacillus dolichus DSM 3991 TaxID=428127 RepID=A8REG3_9FIRM|nr:hypothetical protein EUBDOL_01784 [Amedibacillus dolichus DSM 3991]